MPHLMLSRLPAAGLLALLTALLLSGCFGRDEPDPRAAPASTAGQTASTPAARLEAVVLDLSIEPDLASLVAVAATAAGKEVGVTVLDRGGAPTVTVSARPIPGARTQAVVRRWAAFAGFWSQRGDLTFEALVSGVPLVLPLEHREALTGLLTPEGEPRATWLPTRDLAAALDADDNAVTMLPLGLAAPNLRSLRIDGIDFVRDAGAGSSPLAETIWLAWDDERLAPFGQALAQRIASPPPVVTRLLFTGDILPARCVYARQRALDDYTAAFAATRAVLGAADITIGSLDAAISDAGEPIACERTFNFIAPARSVEGFVAAGFDVVTVATNHAKDCGSLGFVCDNRSFLDSIRLLNEAGIATVGGGKDIEAAHRPAIIERNGVRFAFLGYDDIASSFLGATAALPGTAALSSEALRRDIAAARLVADVVIILPQWGIEYTESPSGRQLALGREAIEAGATLVAGNHPHVVQGVEWNDGGFIAYALGNFIFDQDWSLETQQGAVLEATFHGDRLAGVRLLPVRIRDMFQPHWAEGGEASQIIGRMEASSRELVRR